MRSWKILVVATMTAVALPACSSGSTSGSTSASTHARPSSNAAAGAAPAARAGGSLCDEYRNRRQAMADAYRKAVKGDPADVKAFLDGLVAADTVFAAAAPGEISADAQLILRVHQANREATGQGGWSPLAMARALASDLDNEEYMTAFGKFATYMHDRCGIDISDTTR
jgi:hypothetical protein